MPHRAKDNKHGKDDIRFGVERRMEFNSTRKRMSILVSDPRDGHYKLYVKGADQEIHKRLKLSGQDAKIMEKVETFTEEASQ